MHARHEVTVREKMSGKSLISGFHFVFENKIIFGTITLDMFAVMLGGATTLLPIYAKDILHAGPGGLGLLQAGLPIGSVTMAAVLAHLPPLQKAGRAMLWAVVAFGIVTIGFGLSRWFWLSFALLIICGAVDNISMVVRHTLVQLLTPDTMRGRVSAVNSLFIGTSNELGGFESGLVAYFFGPIFSVVSGGIGTIFVVIAVALIWPEIRRHGRSRRVNSLWVTLTSMKNALGFCRSPCLCFRLLSERAGSIQTGFALYSRYFNAPGENRYEPDGAYSKVLEALRKEFIVETDDRPAHKRETGQSQSSVAGKCQRSGVWDKSSASSH